MALGDFHVGTSGTVINPMGKNTRDHGQLQFLPSGVTPKPHGQSHGHVSVVHGSTTIPSFLSHGCDALAHGHVSLVHGTLQIWVSPWDSINVQSLSHGHIGLVHGMFNHCPVGLFYWSMGHYKCSPQGCYIGPWVCQLGPWGSANVQSLSHGLSHGCIEFSHQKVQMFNPCPMGMFWVCCISPWTLQILELLSHGPLCIAHGPA